MSNEDKELYEFDKFRLDVSERILWREGERLPLSEKAFDTLCSLVRRGNHLVSKDELLNEVWPDAIVEENNLDKNISLLRQVLGERSGTGKFIETVRGHGYRFVAEVRELSEQSAVAGGLTSPEFQISDAKFQIENQSDDTLKTENQAEISNFKSEITANPKVGKQPATDKGQRTKQLRLIMVFGAFVVGAALLGFYVWRSGNRSAVADAPVKTIAVLPFKPLLAENRDEALEMGMADTLISKLGGGDEITVRPLSSVRRYSALDQDSLIAGRELDVETILDGSVQISVERVRVSAKLLRVSDGKQLWAGQFDEKYTDIFAVQDAISEKVATALKFQLTNKVKKRPTENVEAYQLYMKGRFHLLKAITSESDKSISYFQQAIELDPNYALAYAGLADAYRARVVGGGTSPAVYMPKAKAAAEKAIETDDTLAEGHAALGLIIFWYDWDWNAAEKEYKRALQLDPNSADSLQYYAVFLSNTGRHAEALAKIKRARELDPLSLRINAVEGMLLLHAGQTDEAIARLQKTLELDPNYRLANAFVARAYIEKGMFAEAIAATHKAKEFAPESSEINSFGAYALAKAGKITEARSELDEMLKLSIEHYASPYGIALVYNGLDERQKALNYLEKAFAEKDVRMIFLKVEPQWKNLRTEPRFIDLLNRMRFE